jgi:filamentous hemagglutinin family protein
MGCGRAGFPRQRGLRSAREACLILAVLVAMSGSAGAQNWVERDGTIGPSCDPGLDCVLDGDLALLEQWTIPASVGAYSDAQPGDLPRNLFHSFLTFDIGEDFTALFTREPGDPIPENLIVRMTGGSLSRIAGTIDTEGSGPNGPYFPGTDLFLLNPWGIAFTETSSLRLDGSLYASSADVLRFPDTDLEIRGATQGPFLSDMDPTHFGFLVPEPGPIEVDRTGGNGLVGVPAGETFALVGGEVKVLGDGPTLTLQGATVALASVASGGVDVPLDVAEFDARSQAVDALGDVVLGATAGVDVSGDGTRDAGRVVVRGGRFLMLDGADVLASVQDGEAWADEDGMVLPAIDIEVAGRTVDGSVEGVSISGSRADTTSLFAQSQAGSRAGEIRIYGPRVEIVGERIAIETQADAADGADITIDGAEIEIARTGTILARIRTRIRSGADESVRAGTIRIGSDTTESVLVKGGFDVVSLNESASEGGGDIVVRGDVVRVEGGTEISSTAEDSGVGGDVTIVAGVVEVAGADILSVTKESATGGDVDVTADEVTVSQLGVITSVVAPNADVSAMGGDVTILADQVSVLGEDVVTTRPTQISVVTNSGSDGTGGDLTIQARILTVVGGAQLRTSTLGGGPAGALRVLGRDGASPAESVLVTGQADAAGIPSGIFAQSVASGDAGSIDIAARSVEVSDGGQVSASSTNTGAPGSVVITDAEGVVVRGGPRGITGILAESAADCGDDCGNVEITTGTLEVSGGGFLTVSTIDAGDAGSVIVNAEEVIVSGSQGVTRSGIYATTVTARPDAGDSGRIELNVSERLTVTDGGLISVESDGGGFAGDIEIRGAREVRLDSGGEITAEVGNTRIPGPGDDPTADILIEDVGRISVGKGSRITAATTGTGLGGDVTLRATGSVVLQDGAQVTAESTGSADAGSIEIDAGRQFIAVNNSLTPGEGVVSTRAEQAAGGTILIRASELIYLSDSRIETQVEESGTLDNGGDFGTPRFLDSGDSTAPAELVVLNRSRIVASAVNGDGGNILIDGTFLPSEALLTIESLAGTGDSVLDASSATGVPGQVVVTSPGSELAGQLVPLPANYLDASKLLLAPCAARTARTGSFTIELQAVEPPPDAPFTAGWDPEESPGVGLASCPSEETLR